MSPILCRSTIGRLLATGLLAAAGCHSAEPALPDSVHERAVREPAAPPGAPTPLSQETHPVDLGTALRIAAGSHLDILEARARVREAQGNAQAADGYLLPILTAGGTWGRTEGNVQASFGNLGEVNFGTITALGTVQISSNVGQSIYHDLATHRVAAASAEFELAQVQRTLLEVSQAYLSLVEADSIVRINEQFVLETQGLVRYTQAREAQGLGPALDTERAKTQAADAEQRLLVARNERQRRSKTLAAALRLDSSIDLSPVDKDLAAATLVTPAETLQDWLQRAAEHRPETRAFRASREAAEQESKATRWSVWGPQVTAGYLYGGLGRSPSSVDDRDSWVVGVGWSLSFGGPGKIEAADARLQQADLQLQRFQDRLLASVSGAFQEVVLTRQRLDPADRELTAAEKALRLARVNFEGGLLPENDLLLAQLAADQARQRRLEAVSRYDQAQLELMAESGVASVGSLSGGAGSK
ncbi:MAG TPA: TolC family protein [Planctomycetota bacterium]|nr:TolC family protein [Planctomycetota bacterium]